MTKLARVFEGKGRLIAGSSYFSSRASGWSGGKITIFPDKLEFNFLNQSESWFRKTDRKIYNSIVLKFEEIVGYNIFKIPLLTLVFGKELIIRHKNKYYPDYLSITMYGDKVNKIVSILQSQNKKRMSIINRDELWKYISFIFPILIISFGVDLFKLAYSKYSTIGVILLSILVLLYLVFEIKTYKEIKQ